MEILEKKMWHKFNPFDLALHRISLAIATFAHMHCARRVSYINEACKPWIWFEQMRSFSFDDDTVHFDHYEYQKLSSCNFLFISFLSFFLHPTANGKEMLLFLFFGLVKSIVTNTKSKQKKTAKEWLRCVCVCRSWFSTVAVLGCVQNEEAKIISFGRIQYENHRIIHLTSMVPVSVPTAHIQKKNFRLCLCMCASNSAVSHFPFSVSFIMFSRRRLTPWMLFGCGVACSHM